MRAQLTFLALSFLAFVPSVQAEPMFALTSDNKIASFDSDSTQSLIKTVTLSGLQSGETLLAIDFRPATGGLYGLGSTSRLYSVNANSGVATAVGTDPFSPALSGTSFAFDFNPMVDRIRVVSDTGQNIRLNPDTGAAAATDTDLSYDAGDPNASAIPGVTACAYGNNFAAASSTTLFCIDSTANTLVLQGGVGGSPSPNTGILSTLASLGVNPSAVVGMDISALSGQLYASIERESQSSAELYVINLGTGYVMGRYGTIGTTTAATDIAVPMFEAVVPTITLTNPTRNVRTNRSNVNFSGVTSDDTQVVKVQYRTVRSGRASAYRTATGTDSFSFRVSNLLRGRTTVQIKAIDLFGNESALTNITITRR